MPRCDAWSGPVAHAAREALATGDVKLVEAWVHAAWRPELRLAFDRARRASADGPSGADVATQWFLETAVRLHRLGERAPFVGLRTV